MSDVLFMLGTRPVTVAEILLAIGGIALVLLLARAESGGSRPTSRSRAPTISKRG